MEPNFVAPDTREAIYRHQHNRSACYIKHDFRADVLSALNDPVRIHPRGLGGNRDEQEVGEDEAVESLHFVLERGHDGDGRIEGVTKEKVDCAYIVFEHL